MTDVLKDHPGGHAPSLPDSAAYRCVDEKAADGYDGYVVAGRGAIFWWLGFLESKESRSRTIKPRA